MIKLKNIEKIYNQNKENEFRALKDINIQFENNGLVFLEGQSGSGKSTLLNIIAGFDKPTSGEIESSYDKNFSSMIFQDFQLIDSLTINQNLDLVTDLMPNEIDKKPDLVKKYGLTDVLNHYPSQISGGEKQRVAIVRALLQNRPLIICDEPTGNLDEDNAIKIADALLDEAEKRLVIVASHDTELFINRCNRHIAIKKGQIIKDEQIKEVSNSEEIKISHRKPKLKLKTQIFLSFKLSKKFKKKNIFLFITLFLALIILLTSFNGLLNTKPSVIYKTYKKINEPYIDFVLNGRTGEKSLIESDYQKLIDTNLLSHKFIDDCSKPIYSVVEEDSLDFPEEIAVINRIYLKDDCHKEILIGSSSTKDGGVIISDYIATKLKEYYKLNSYEEVLNLIVLGDMPTVGIFKTGYLDEDKSQKGDYLNFLYQVIYLSEKTYSDYYLKNKDQCGITAKFNQITKTNTTAYKEYQLSESLIEYGELTPLNKGEIALSTDLAGYYTNDPESLINQRIEIEHFNYRDGNLETYANKVSSYKVKYIYNKNFNSIMLSADDFLEINNNYNYDFYSRNVWGASIYHPTEKTISNLLENGYIEVSYMSYEINEGTDWLDTLAFVELGVGLTLLVIAVIVLCNHSSLVIDREKRVLGVLVSLGIPVKKTVWTYLINIAIYLFSAIILADIFEILMIYIINRIVINMGITNISLLSYHPLSILMIAGFFIIIIILLYIFISSKLKKKQIIDIIYER